MEIQYLGEHIIPGSIGRLAILLAMISAIVSAVAYYANSYSKTQKSNLAARRIFQFHSVMIFVASAVLFIILLGRYYEYNYVYMHIENDLGLGYQFAAFWAGQEGSMLFWGLCQAIIGLVLIRKAGEWENKVMAIVALSQFFVTTLLLGLRVGDMEIGLSPFKLLREIPQNAANEFFQNPNYLSMIADGNGLNPLLRNFWMMSHPPVLFIGFALALVPFAYALAALWKKDYTGWIPQALPWTNITVFFMGAGILLGGVWAYESLTFGGFWAWDPIENASLVPWLILIAALHLQIVAKKKKENFFPAFLFTFLTFIFVIYSTYLTRSGVLAETSVHSFGNTGTGNHILAYLFTFLLISVVPLALNFKKLPSQENDQPISKEFWLFISAMVLVLSAFQIIFTTSIPVWNKVFGSQLSPPADVVSHYNTWQLPFAVLVAFLMAMAHFLKWGKTDITGFLKRTSFSFALAIVFTVLIIVLLDESQWQDRIFLFTGLFALFSSLDMLLRFSKTFANTPALISHLGIALFLVAVLLTFSQKQTISENTSGYNLGESFPANENLLLLKDSVLPMGDYFVSYRGNQRQGEDIQYTIDFLKKNKEGQYYLSFTSNPTIKLNERMGNVYNPHTKVYLGKDIFTYITFADVNNHGMPQEPALIGNFELTRGDTIQADNNHLVLTSIESIPSQNSDVIVEATIDIITHFGATFTAKPRFVLRERELNYEDAFIEDLEYRVRFADVSEKPFTIKVELYEHQPEFIIIKTIIFPYINLLWISCVIMLTGFWLSFRNRWKLRNKPAITDSTDQ